MISSEFRVGTEPAGIVYAPKTGDLYVTNFESNTVSVKSPHDNKATKTIPVGRHPMGIAYDSGNGDIYVADSDSFSVSVINTSNNMIASTIQVGASPNGMAYDPENGKIYAVNQNSYTVSVISTASTVPEFGSVAGISLALAILPVAAASLLGRPAGNLRR